MDRQDEYEPISPLSTVLLYLGAAVFVFGLVFDAAALLALGMMFDAPGANMAVAP